MAGKKILKRIDYLLSKEKGTVFKDPGGKINICLVYPNTYHIGMSSLGFQGLYTLLNERPDVVCERAFLPDEEDLEEYIRTGAEIISFESKRPLSRFEVIAFSVSFENDYPNILRILGLSRIPSRSAQRSGMHPLLIMGGVVAFFNPEPLAEFFDFCFVGEAEEMLREFIDAYINSGNREDLYRRAAGIEGVYIPKFYDIQYTDDNKLSFRAGLNNAPVKIKRRFINNLDENRLRPSILTDETEFSNMYLVEAMRGCPWSCRFCATGYIFNPPRRKSPDILKRDINETLSITDRIGLIGPSLTDYPYITDILSIEGVDFSITSLRASKKSAEIMRSLKKHKSISIAPEAGTERLRKAIDKKITNEDIIETSRLILGEGIENLRLYFMVGLPTEEDTDIEGLISLVRTIRSFSDKGNLVLTISTFIPKPFTPFQWHPMEKPAVVKDRLQMIKKSLAGLRGVRVFHDVLKYSYMQGLFSRGDRRISHTIEGMVSGRDWQKACRASGINADFYLYRNIGFNDMLPWDFIDNGIAKERLWAEYQEALAT